MFFCSFPGCSLLIQSCLYTGTTCPLNLSSLMQLFSLHLYILDPLDGFTIPQFTTHFHTSVPLLKLFLLLQLPLPLCLGSFYLTLRANSYAFVSLITHNQAEFIASSLICLSDPTLFLSILCWAASSMGAKVVLQSSLFPKQISIAGTHKYYVVWISSSKNPTN